MINKTSKVIFALLVLSLYFLSQFCTVYAEDTDTSSKANEYQITCDTIDLGTLDYGYKDTEFTDIIVRSTGKSDLTNVCLIIDDSVRSWFIFQIDDTFIDIKAGNDSKGHWFVKPEYDLAPGEYSAVVKVSAGELDEPVKFEIKVNVKDRPDISGVSTTKAENGKGRNRVLDSILYLIVFTVLVVLIVILINVKLNLKKKKNNVK